MCNMYVYVHICVMYNMCVYVIYVYICICVHAYMCIYMYITYMYIWTHIGGLIVNSHTHIHTQIYFIKIQHYAHTSSSPPPSPSNNNCTKNKVCFLD